MSFSAELLARAHSHSIRNRQEIERSGICGCFYCCATFPSSAIERWLAVEDTALCAECQIDSVLGDASGFPVSEPDFLRAMHERWFVEGGDDVGVSEPEAAFDHELEMSAHDPRAEEIARARGMSEEEIAMIKAGLEDSRAGRVVSSSELFARLAQKYGW